MIPTLELDPVSFVHSRSVIFQLEINCYSDNSLVVCLYFSHVSSKALGMLVLVIGSPFWSKMKYFSDFMMDYCESLVWHLWSWEDQNFSSSASRGLIFFDFNEISQFFSGLLWNFVKLSVSCSGLIYHFAAPSTGQSYYCPILWFLTLVLSKLLFIFPT